MGYNCKENHVLRSIKGRKLFQPRRGIRLRRLSVLSLTAGLFTGPEDEGPRGHYQQKKITMSEADITSTEAKNNAFILEEITGAHQGEPLPLILSLGVNPFTSRFIFRTALRGGFARSQWAPGNN